MRLAAKTVATTTSEGNFQATIPPGKYLLYSEQFDIFKEHVTWCVRFDASDSEINLSYDQKKTYDEDGHLDIEAGSAYGYDACRIFDKQLRSVQRALE